MDLYPALPAISSPPQIRHAIPNKKAASPVRITAPFVMELAATYKGLPPVNLRAHEYAHLRTLYNTLPRLSTPLHGTSLMVLVDTDTRTDYSDGMPRGTRQGEGEQDDYQSTHRS